MTISLKLTFPGLQKVFDAAVKKEIKDHISRKIGPVLARAQKRIAFLFITEVFNSEEYKAITVGELRGEIGLPEPDVINSIINKWAKGIIVKYSPRGATFGKVTVHMIQSDYSDVLSLPEAAYTYSTRTGNNTIEWLRWLLLESTSVIVLDYDFVKSNKGRTGMGIMINKSGGGWKIPEKYAGSADDNFVTRSLKGFENTIDMVLNQEINDGL